MAKALPAYDDRMRQDGLETVPLIDLLQQYAAMLSVTVTLLRRHAT
jgi:hypothetical protein